MSLTRPRHAASGPMTPLWLFGGLAVAGAAIALPPLTWLALGGVAGYSLSGSV